jgi:hypothetical protein
LGRAETHRHRQDAEGDALAGEVYRRVLPFLRRGADKLSGEVLPIDKPDLFVFSNREPLGVVAAVVPWNSQLFLTAVKIGPAGGGEYGGAEGVGACLGRDAGIWRLIAEAAGFRPGW